MRSNEKNRRRWKVIYTTAIFLAFIVGHVQLGIAQRIAGESGSGTSQVEDPHRLPGKLLVEGNNITPTGPFGLLTYQLEEVSLPTPRRFQVRGERKQLETLIRLNITGEFLGSGYVIWINDKALKNIAQMGLKKISVFILDRSLLEDGAVLAVAPSDKEYDRVPLAERLNLPASLKDATPPAPAHEIGIGLTLRSTPVITKKGLQFNVQIITYSSVGKFPAMNSFIYLHVGRYEFSGDISSDGSSASFNLTQEEFARLQDGDLLIVNYQSGAPNWAGGGDFWNFGSLDKSKLDK